MGIYKTKSDQSKIGNYMAHVGKPGVLGLGTEEITVGYEQKQVGLTEPEEEGQEPEPIWADDESRPIKELTGYWLYEIDGDEIPTEQQVEVDYEEPAPEEGPLTDVDIAREYELANEAAKKITFLLMARVSMGLVGLKLRMANGDLITSDNVNAEGTRFVSTHKRPLDVFQSAGRHPDAGDALYSSIFAEGSVALYPWLNNATIQGIFAATIPRYV